MSPQDVCQPAMPPITLSTEDSCGFRYLRPRNRVGNESNLARTSLFIGEPLEPQHELHIFADSIVQISSRLQHRFALKQPERAGDNDIAAKPVPAESAEEKGAEVFDYLNSCQ